MNAPTMTPATLAPCAATFVPSAPVAVDPIAVVVDVVVDFDAPALTFAPPALPSLLAPMGDADSGVRARFEPLPSLAPFAASLASELATELADCASPALAALALSLAALV